MAKGNNNLSGRRSSAHNAKPYDANNSFVKKVATKVTDFIPQKSWISKWFNTSQNEDDTLDYNQNSDEVESEEDTQKPPPLKRPCIRMDITHPPGTFTIQPSAKSTNKTSAPKQQHSMQNEMSMYFSKPVMAGPSGMSNLISSTPATQSEIRNTVSQRSKLNSLDVATSNGTTNCRDDNSESSESTSGCSSLIPQTSRQEVPSNTVYNSSFPSRRGFQNDKLNFTNHKQSPRSLFLDNTARDSLSSHRPSFNASLMTYTPDRGSPLASPFYSGNITFGGANAAGLYKPGRNLFNSTNEIQLKVPKRTSVEVKPSNAAGADSSGMSQTAKKILEALEHFSSPITDAKKIPLKMTCNTSPTCRKRARDEITPPATKVGLRHLTRELTIPTIPDILKLKQRQKLQNTTAAARRIILARSEPPPRQEYYIRTTNDEESKRHGKVKVKGADFAMEETVESVNLPNIPLPISTLPNFNFMSPANVMPASKRSIEKEEAFTFSSPIKIASGTKNLKSINNFTFSTPIDLNQETTDKVHDTVSPLKGTIMKANTAHSEYVIPVTQNFKWSGSSTAPRPKEKVKANENTIPPTVNELKSGSVMDVLCSRTNTTDSDKLGEIKTQLSSEKGVINKRTSPVISNMSKDNSAMQCENSTLKIQNGSTTWECSECLIKNSNSEKQCLACKTEKSSVQSMKTSEVSSPRTVLNEKKTEGNDNFGSQFKLSINQWKCPTCFVKNKQTDTKCVACTGHKPTMKQETKSNATVLISSDVKSDKSAEKLWTCLKCQLKNTENSLICVSCKSSKSTLLHASTQKDVDITHDNTKPTKDETMDKLKPSKDTWECPCCMVRNATSVDTCPCCNTANPNTGVVVKSTQPLVANGFGDKFKKPEGAWNCETCMVQNKPEVIECIACGGLKPGSNKSENLTNSTASSLQFSFEIPANAGNFKFGVDKAEGEKPNNTVSANGFVFGNNEKSSQINQFTFGIPKEHNVSKEAAESGNKSSALGSGFGMQTTTSNSKKGDVQQDSGKLEKDTKATFSVDIPKQENVAVNINPETSVSPPIYAFGIPKSSSAQTEVKNETQSPFPGNITTATTVTSESGPTSVSTLPSLIQSSSQETKPTATFLCSVPSSTTPVESNTFKLVAASLPSSTSSSFTFTEPKTTIQATPVPVFNHVTATVPLTSSTTTNTFTFGENKTTDGSSATFSLLTNTASASTPFSSISSAPSIFSNNKPKSTLAFGQVSTEESKQQPTFGSNEKKSSTFGIPENQAPKFVAVESKPSIFGTPDTKRPMFESTDNKTTSLFNATPQEQIALPAATATATATPASTPALTQTPTPTPTPFGAPSSMSSLFGSSTTSMFGNNTTPTFAPEGTPSMFGTTTTNATGTSTPNPNLFTFGNTATQPTVQPGAGFNFTANPPAAETTQKPLFSFGSNTTTPQSSNLFSNAFNNPTPDNSSGFTFNAPKPETSAFGQPTAPTSIFGGLQASAQSQVPPSFSSTPANTGFNFGATAPVTSSGGFNFGAGVTAAPSVGFNFNAPSTTPFDPNTPPSFKFTCGNTPEFNAPPASMQRKPKKGIRRLR